MADNDVQKSVIAPDNDPTGRLCNNCGEAQLIAHADAFFHCPSCGRGYTADQLEALANKSDRAQINQDIRDCYLEDTRRGSRGGGSGDKGPKKEDKLGARSLRQVTWTDEATTTLKQESMEPKDAWLSVRGIPEGVSGETVRKAIERKLGL